MILRETRQIDEFFGERGCNGTPKIHCNPARRQFDGKFFNFFVKLTSSGVAMVHLKTIATPLDIILTKKIGFALKISQKQSI